MEVAKRWGRQYYYTKKGDSKQVILAKLQALSLATTSAAEVATIIGNDSWTRLTCDCCGSDVVKVVRLKDAGDDSCTDICTDCALDILRKLLCHDD